MVLNIIPPPPHVEYMKKKWSESTGFLYQFDYIQFAMQTLVTNYNKAYKIRRP